MFALKRKNCDLPTLTYDTLNMEEVADLINRQANWQKCNNCKDVIMYTYTVHNHVTSSHYNSLCDFCIRKEFADIIQEDEQYAMSNIHCRTENYSNVL